MVHDEDGISIWKALQYLVLYLIWTGLLIGYLIFCLMEMA
jgi:hypothetical protein